MKKGDTLTHKSLPIIGFVHVPKTAGSTVKEMLGLCSPYGHGDCQNLSKNDPATHELVRSLEWISGHISRPDLAALLTWTGRSVEYYATVREPFSQIVSHINWSIHKLKWKNYLNLVPYSEMVEDYQVANANFSNQNSIISLLIQQSEKFLNRQSRLILGDDFSYISTNEIKSRLKSYVFIATEKNVPSLLKCFGFVTTPSDVGGMRVNVAKNYVKDSLVDSGELKKFLHVHNAADYKLYELVQELDFQIPYRAPFRNSSAHLELVTPDNFDETRYLASNNDVRAAVLSGKFLNGREHFDKYGVFEKRRYARSPEQVVDGLPDREPENADILKSISQIRNLLQKL